MKVFQTKKDIAKHINEFKMQNHKVGFVPTMGALHQGHLALVKNSLQEDDITVVSIFVNPTQFDNLDDLQKYPRTFLQDLQKLKNINQDILVYYPIAEDLYDGKIKRMSFDFQGLEKEMEGKHRPGHFDGVGTVVKKLFEAIKPDRAYFGEKDFQQLQIIKKLVEIEDMKIKIMPVPIYRESDGLAMSSRNLRLSNEMRKAAPFIYETLKKTKEKWKNQSINEIKEFVEESFIKHPLLKLEYFEIADEKLLKPAKEKNPGNKYRGFIVVYAGDVRLIDNIGYN